jgi:MFS family permease
MLRNRSLLAVSLAIAASYAGIGMVAPVRVLYAQSRGASLAIISAMASAYLISNFLFQYPSGWLADRWGRKRIMVAGIAVQAVLTASYLLVTDPVLFVVLRFLEGIGAAAILPSARALIAEDVPAERRGEAYGIFSAFFNAGFLLGPAFGGLLATLGYASAFIGSVFVRLIALAIVMVLIHDVGRVSRVEHERVGVGSRRALFTPPLLGAYILGFGDSTLFPLWMRHHLGASLAIIGLASTLWALPSIVISPIGGRLADRRRRSPFILIFGLAQVPFYIAYGLLHAMGVMLALFTLHAVIYSLMQPAVDAHLAAFSPPAARARAQSMYVAIGLAGAFIAANGVSPLYRLDFRLPLFVLAVAYGICIVAGGVLVRLAEARRSAPAVRESTLIPHSPLSGPADGE